MNNTESRITGTMNPLETTDSCKCVSCNYGITGNSIHYENENYHIDCWHTKFTRRIINGKIVIAKKLEAYF